MVILGSWNAIQQLKDQAFLDGRRYLSTKGWFGSTKGGFWAMGKFVVHIQDLLPERNYWLGDFALCLFAWKIIRIANTRFRINIFKAKGSGL